MELLHKLVTLAKEQRQAKSAEELLNINQDSFGANMKHFTLYELMELNLSKGSLQLLGVLEKMYTRTLQEITLTEDKKQFIFLMMGWKMDSKANKDSFVAHLKALEKADLIVRTDKHKLIFNPFYKMVGGFDLLDTVSNTIAYYTVRDDMGLPIDTVTGKRFENIYKSYITANIDSIEKKKGKAVAKFL